MRTNSNLILFHFQAAFSIRQPKKSETGGLFLFICFWVSFKRTCFLFFWQMSLQVLEEFPPWKKMHVDQKRCVCFWRSDSIFGWIFGWFNQHQEEFGSHPGTVFGLWVGSWLDTVSHKKRRCVDFMWTWYVKSLFTKVRGFIVWGWLPSVSGIHPNPPVISMFLTLLTFVFDGTGLNRVRIQSSWHPQMKALRVASEFAWCLVQILEDLMSFQTRITTFWMLWICFYIFRDKSDS